MANQSLRDRMREQMVKRVRESYENRESTGRGASFFKKGKIDGVFFWECEMSTKDPHVIDIVPYIVGSNDPKLTKGDINYVLDVWVHRGIGANESTYICPARNYNRPCPICEHINELKRMGEYDEEMIKLKYPKRRVVYNMLCYDSDREENKGVQIWEVAHWFMERHLAPLARAPKTGGFIPFADAEIGKSISFTKESKTEFIGHRLIDRDYVISDEILEQAYCLDDMIEILSYDELRLIYYGKSDSSDNEEHESSCNENTEEQVLPDAMHAPRRRVRSRSAEQPKLDTPTDSCPMGGTFGKDIDVFDKCATCSKWDDCAKVADGLSDVPF